MIMSVDDGGRRMNGDERDVNEQENSGREKKRID